MKFSWKTGITVLVILGAAFAVVLGLKNPPPEVKTENGYPEVAEFSKPIPEPTGDADGIAASIFAEMDEESTAFTAQMEESSSNASNGNNELETFTYAEEF